MSSDGSKQSIPWKRFWCRLGDAIHISEHGFLTDPEGDFAYSINRHLFTLGQILSEPCLVLCGAPGIGKTTEIQQAKSEFECRLGHGVHRMGLAMAYIWSAGSSARNGPIQGINSAARRWRKRATRSKPSRQPSMHAAILKRYEPLSWTVATQNLNRDSLESAVRAEFMREWGGRPHGSISPLGR